DPTRRAADQDRLACLRGDRGQRVDGGGTGQAERAGSGDLDTGRQGRDADLLQDGHVLTEPAVAEIRLGHHAEHRIAGLEAASPTASTVPAKSLPSPTGNRCSIVPARRPATTDRSKPFTDDACTRTSTSPGPGRGVGSSISSGLAPCSVITTALMVTSRPISGRFPPVRVPRYHTRGR